jgi:hypothetical protein
VGEMAAVEPTQRRSASVGFCRGDSPCGRRRGEPR